MRCTKPKAFPVVVLSFLVWSQSSCLWAGQASARQYAAYFQTQRAASPDEIQLSDYRLERAAILRNLAKNKSSHVLKQKLLILNNKITYLENQLRRARPLKKPMVHQASQGLTRQPSDIMFPSAASVPARPFAKKPEAPVQKPKPVILENRQKLSAAPVTLSGEPAKISASFETKPSNIPPTPVINPATDQTKPAVFRALPVLSPFKSESVTSFSMPRQTPVVQPAQKVQNISPAPAMSAPPKPQAIPQAAVSAAENTPAPTEAPENMEPIGPKHGSDWLKMSRDEKELYIFSAMGALVKHDVVSMKPSYFYIQSLDTKIQNDRASRSQELDSLFVSSVYENEPDTRSAIDGIGQKGEK